MKNNAEVPVLCGSPEASLTGAPTCTSSSDWEALAQRTQAYGEDTLMWNDVAARDGPKFRIAGDALAGLIYPKDEDQTLGKYFYHYLIEQCT